MRDYSKKIYYAAPYYRISTDDGDLAVSGKGESNSISNQRSLIEDYVKDKQDIVLCGERIDDGFSGVNFERPAFKAMIEDIKAGRINCVIVKDLSRFGRNYIEVGRYVQKIFPCLGVRFIAVNDHYDSMDTDDMEDSIMLPFKNLMNDSYSRDLSIKVRSQFEIKRKRGEFIGSFAPYGYKKDPENKNHLVIDEYAALIVRDIFQWRISGISNEKIADKLNEMGVLSPAEYKHSQGSKYYCGFGTDKPSKWSPVSVGRILTNQNYLGWVVQGRRTTPNYKVKKVIQKKPEEWITVKNMHDAIISEDDFFMVQNLLKMDARSSPGEECVNLFSGIMECGDCHSRMNRKLVSAGKSPQGKTRKYPYYICSANKKDKNICSSHMISEKELEKAVLSAINGHILAMGELKEAISALEGVPLIRDETKKIDIQLLKVNEEMVRLQNVNLSLYEDLEEGVIDKKEYFELKQVYKEQMDELEKKKASLKQEQELCRREYIRKNQWIDDFLQYQNFSSLSRNLLLKLVEKIIVYEKKRIKIIFRFQHNDEMALNIVKLYQRI